jgi:methionyl-tRNA synthetase
MYLTTAICYLNGDPHMGHHLEIVVSDIISRYHKFKLGQDNVVFQTGTDEHGQKISDKAKSVDLKPIELCDQNLVKFQTLYQSLNIGFDNFVRTSSKTHYATVQHVFQLLKATGDIYLGKYEGWYNSREEKYVSELQAKMCNYKDEVTGKALERIEEESYFFKMSKYQDRLIKFYTENPQVFPDKTHHHQILKRLEEPLQDLSISRTNFDWGVPLDEGHVCYVWFDALLNYLSGIDYFGLDTNNRYHGKGKDIWQNTYHVIGKDIVWFHSVIWYSMLMALDITLPKEIIVHGFVTDKDGVKMSKTLGNVINPFDLLKDYPVDTLRAFCVRYNNIEADTKCSAENITKFHNGELANNIGNLVNRLTNLIHKNYDSLVPVVVLEETDMEFIDLLDNSHLDRLDKLYSEYAFRDIFQLILNLFQQLNGWLTDKEPWKIKDNSELKAKILRVGLERLYQLNHLLIPIMPETSDKIFVLINRTTLTYQKLREYNRTLHEGFNDLVLEKYKMILFPKIETEMEVQIKLSKKKNPKGKN